MVEVRSRVGPDRLAALKMPKSMASVAVRYSRDNHICVHEDDHDLDERHPRVAAVRPRPLPARVAYRPLIFPSRVSRASASMGNPVSSGVNGAMGASQSVKRRSGSPWAVR